MIIKLNKEEIKQVKKDIIDDVVKSTLREEIQKEINSQFKNVIKDSIKKKVEQFSNFELKEIFKYELRNIINKTYLVNVEYGKTELNTETKDKLFGIIKNKVLGDLNINNLKYMVKEEIKRKLME